MAIYSFGVWSTSNLIAAPGSTPIATNQTNGNPQVGDTFTIGIQDAEDIVIDDAENDLFEDDLQSPQFLNQALTIGTNSYPVGTQVQNEFVLITDQLDENGDPIEIIVIRFDPPGGGGLSTTAYALTGPLPDGTTFTITGTRDRDLAPDAPPYPSFICFAAGTMIQTGQGEVAVEALGPGDRVVTLDHGLQAVRWAGQRRVVAKGAYAPIRIAPGILGNTRPLSVSPQHRLLITSSSVDLHFGTSNALVAALHLTSADGIDRVEGGQVTYVHLLFDRHEIIFADGIATESFHPGSVGLTTLDQASLEEIMGLFPDLQTSPAARITARPVLRRHEARLLLDDLQGLTYARAYADQTPKTDVSA